MTPREQFDKMRGELLEKGELTLKTIMHNGEEVPSLKLIVQDKRWMLEEITAMDQGRISRRTRPISQKRAENYIWAHLPPIQPTKEEGSGVS